MPAPTISEPPELPSFPAGRGLPDQPGVFIAKVLAFLAWFTAFRTYLLELTAYFEGLASSTGETSAPAETNAAGIRRLTVRNISQNDLSAGTYTLASADVWAHLRFTSAAAVTLNVKQGHGFSPGDRVRFTQAGAGQVTIVAGNAVTLNSADDALTSRVQHSIWELECVGLNEFDVLGDVVA